jgi:uncharacterized protein (DUF697 family)
MSRRNQQGGSGELLDDLMHLLDRLPFVSGLKRDVSDLRRIVYERRAPRIAAVGRPGSGRSTLLNALLGKDALPLEQDEQTAPGQWVRVDAAGSHVAWLEVPIDPDTDTSRALRRALDEMSPDCVLFVAGLHELEQDGLSETARAATSLIEGLTQGGDSAAPVLAVLTHVDQLPPEDAVRAPLPTEKENAIELECQRLERFIRQSGLRVEQVLAVGVPGAPSERSDGYGLGALTRAVYERMPEQGRLETARAFIHAAAPRRELATTLVHSCAALAATIAVTPIPLSDLWVLGSLQVGMVSTIAHLSGRPWDKRAVWEWMASTGVVGGAGLGLRWGAQQLCKLLPAAGSLVSAGVAGSGTLALGRSAMRYFLHEQRGHLEKVPA